MRSRSAVRPEAEMRMPVKNRSVPCMWSMWIVRQVSASGTDRGFEQVEVGPKDRRVGLVEQAVLPHGVELELETHVVAVGARGALEIGQHLGLHAVRVAPLPELAPEELLETHDLAH